MAGRNVVTLQCRTCGGVYAPVLPDGMQYFHVCPPIAAVTVRAKDGSLSIVPDTKDVDQSTVVAHVGIDRANARNENPHPTARDAAGKAVIIAEGAGVDTLAAADAIPVLVPGAVGSRTA